MGNGRKWKITGLLLALGLGVAGAVWLRSRSPEPAYSRPVPLYDTPEALAANLAKPAERIIAEVAEWQLANPAPLRKGVHWDNGWARATFYIGLLEAYEATGESRYLDAARRWAEANQYRVDPRFAGEPAADQPLSADDLAAGRAYLDLFRLEGGHGKLSDLGERAEALELESPPGDQEWHWCDAWFMAPPTLIGYGMTMGDREVVELAHRMFRDSADVLYDAEEQLVYRDERYLGTGTFWSRGNGWALAGLVRILGEVPEGDEYRPGYLRMFRSICSRLPPLQRSDGTWSPDLLNPDYSAETSGTALFCYGLYWGINRGVLGDEYLPVAEKSWHGLLGHLRNGKLGMVQDVGCEPGPVEPWFSHEYGSGAMLLAACERARFERAREQS